MSDIFISYSSADRDRARVMAQALEQRGWSVWWDREIPPGRAYDDVIEEALDAARCVVVLWSKTSAVSSWVKNEASDAMQRKVLIPALIDPGVKIPLEFRRLQAADLSRWRGEASAEFQQFCDAVARNVGGDRPPPPPPPEHDTPTLPSQPQPESVAAPKTRSSKVVWIGVGIGVLVLGGIGSLMSDQDKGPRNIDPAPHGKIEPFTPPAPVADTNAGPGTMLAWRDHALAYQGRFTMTNLGAPAHLSIDVRDGNTGRSLGHRELTAYGRENMPGQNVWTAEVEVDGDSVKATPHVHPVNLVFERQANGYWAFVRNCSAPGDCYEVPH